MAAAIALSPAGHLLAAPQYWDTDGSVVGNDTTTGAGLGGTGNWSTAVANWWDGGAPGTLAGWTEGNDAFFLGTPGIVTLSGPRTANSITLGSTGYTITAQTLTLTGAAQFDVPVGTGTIASILAGTAGYNKSGPGTLILTNSGNTNTGPINITGGVLQITTSARIGGTGVGAGNVNLNGGALRNDDPSTSAVAFLTGNRGITVGSNGGSLNVSTSGAVLQYTSGSITGPGNTLTKSGPGTLRVTTPTAITFSKLLVNGGLYQAAADNIFGAVPASFLADAITLDNGGGISINAGFTFSPNRGITLAAGGGVFSATSSGTISSVISGPGAFTKAGSGSLNLTGNNTFQGGFNILGGTVVLNADAAAGTGPIAITPASAVTIRTVGTNISNSFANDIVLNPGAVSTLDFFATTGNSITLSGKISGAANWTRGQGGGAGTVALTNSTNDFTGSLTVAQGILAITANNALGSAAGGTTVNSGATLIMRGGFDYATLEPLTIAGTGTANTGAIVNFQDNNRFAGPITMTANSGVGVTSGQLELAGPISGSFRLQKEGPGTLVLAHPGNSFGSMAVNAGTVVVSADGNLGAAPLAFSANNVQLAITALRATSSFSVHPNRGINLVSNGSIDVSTGITLTYPGTMGGGALNKMGAGTLVLSGVNAHTGGTTIHAGTLSLTSTGVLPGDVTIAPGAALHGSGSVGGNVTVGGTLSPGASPGALTTTGSHTWQGGGAYTWEIDNATGAPVTNWDRVTMNAVTISATATNKFTIRIVALPGGGGPALDNFDPDAPASWVIATATSGTVTNFDLEAFEIDASQFEQNNENKGGFYVSRSSGDLMLNYVPEPSGGVLLALAATITLRRRRRRSR